MTYGICLYDVPLTVLLLWFEGYWYVVKVE